MGHVRRQSQQNMCIIGMMGEPQGMTFPPHSSRESTLHPWECDVACPCVPGFQSAPSVLSEQVKLKTSFLGQKKGRTPSPLDGHMGSEFAMALFL